MKFIFKALIFSPIFLFFSCGMNKNLTKIDSMQSLDYGLPVEYLSLDKDLKLAYTESGNGAETLIFIHGLGSYIPSWKKNLAGLQSKYRCIAIDLPGYGKSSKGNYNVTMDFFAETIQKFCQLKKLEKVVLVGHSMGGQIAITTALKFPELVQKLVLVAPAGFETFNKGEKQWFRDVMTVDGVRLTTVEQIRINYAYNFYEFPKDANFMVDDRIAMRSAKDFNDYCYHITQGVKAMVDNPVFDFLQNLKQPTLCIFGENDNLIPNRYLHGGPSVTVAKKGAAKIPNCKLEMVKKAGHFVMFEQATICNQLIDHFLGK